MNYNLVISVVLYKTSIEYIKNIINCFENSTLENIKLVFVDNSPEKIYYFVDNFKNNSKIEYIFSGKNSGYGSGHNIAINKYINEAKYHLVLNPDITFDKDLLRNVFEKMENHPEVGLSSVKITFPNGKIQYVHRSRVSFLNWFRRVINYSVKFFFSRISLFEKTVINHELIPFYKEKEFFADCISGCFMFFRNSALKKIGFFNEKFFMYCEDLEISDRMRKLYKNKIFCEFFVMHIWQAESRKSIKMIWVHLKSLFRYFLNL